MKKLFAALMCVMAVALVGCKPEDPNKSGTDVKDVDVTKVDDKTEKCWAIGITGTVDDIEASQVSYFWGTEKAVVEEAQEELKAFDEMTQKYGLTLNITVKYMEADPKSEEACKQQDEATQKEYEESGECWKITMSAGMLSEEYYVWGHDVTIKIAEAQMEAMLKNYGITSGYEIKHEKVEAENAEACEKNNKVY